MKKLLLTAALMTAFFVTGCETDEESQATGRIVVQAFDAPFQGDVEHIYLNIEQVSIHKETEATDTTESWIILSETDTVIDFLELVNGQMLQLLQSDIETGKYSQMRLLLGDSSTIVVDGTTYDLRIPSGSQSGVKLNLGFSIEADEVVEFYLDFDASRSINKHPNQERYSLRPTFRVFKSVVSGTVSGTVVDTSGNPLEDISVYAVSATDSLGTLTGESGEYKLIVLEGTYSVSAQGYQLIADTAYQAVEIQAGSELNGFDFILNSSE